MAGYRTVRDADAQQYYVYDTFPRAAVRHAADHRSLPNGGLDLRVYGNLRHTDRAETIADMPYGPDYQDEDDDHRSLAESFDTCLTAHSGYEGTDGRSTRDMTTDDDRTSYCESSCDSLDTDDTSYYEGKSLLHHFVFSCKLHNIFYTIGPEYSCE